MLDLIFLAGQMLCTAGLAYGWFVVLTYNYRAPKPRTRSRDTALLHHMAMA